MRQPRMPFDERMSLYILLLRAFQSFQSRQRRTAGEMPGLRSYQLNGRLPWPSTLGAATFRYRPLAHFAGFLGKALLSPATS